MTPEDEPLRSEGVKCATGEEQRTCTSSARKNEATGSKPKGHSVADVSDGERRVRCCKDQYSIGTWTIRSMNQGKLDVVKQEMTRLNIDSLGISELKWTGMGKPFNITVVQVYAPTTDAEEAEVDRFYEGLQHLLELTPKNYVLIIMGDWNAKVGSQKITGIAGKFGLGVQNEAGHRLVEFCQENTVVIANTLFQQPKRCLYTWTSPDGQHRNQMDYVLCSQRWKSSMQSVKTRPGADCGSDHELLVAKFRLKLKKVGKSTRPLRYDLNHIPDEYTVEETNRFKELDLIDRMPEELWTEVCNIVQEVAPKTIPKKKKCKKAKWLSEEALQIAEERRKAKGKGERERYTQLNAEFQRIASRDKNAFLKNKHIMRKAGLDESPVGIKIAWRNINNLRYADDSTLMAESEEELKSLLMWVKEESAKIGLKLNIKKTKIMASDPITSWQIDGEEMEESRVLRTVPLLAACLPEDKCKVLIGRRFSEDKYPDLASVCRNSNTLILYPGAGAANLEEEDLNSSDPYVIIIIDGTWSQAKDIFFKNSLFRIPKQVRFNIL
ncbi:Craniofacial development protein 2 [Varanus komodoensis]|nr:Craniofacial development protein 2 [Varanus komodoensis]